MTEKNRRIFMLRMLPVGAVLALQGAIAPSAAAASPTDAVKETDPYPKSMGYRLNTADVDKNKFPRHDVSQKCSVCQLYAADPGGATGQCSFFKRTVVSNGWCRNFKPKKA
jgi:hypothetical protein